MKLLEYRSVIKLKTITPLFMYGATDQRAEIRAASIKGIMRWWWRAVKAYNNTEKLFNKESEIFGFADSGASKVRLEIWPSYGVANERLEVRRQYDRYSRQHQYTTRIVGASLNWTSRRKVLGGRHYGIAYLLYPQLMLLKGSIPYVPPNTEFSLVLRSRYKDKLDKALASLWCAVWFGGFGRRSRRGGGNLTFLPVVEEEEEEKEKEKEGNYRPKGLDFVFNGSGGQDFRHWLERNFRVCRNLLSGSEGTDKYSNISTLRVVISQRGFREWYEALNDIGRIFYDFRRHTDHRANCIFGLPHPHPRTCTGPPSRNQGDPINRRASPVIIKVVKVGDRFHWMVLRLNGKFLPDGRWSFRPIDNFWTEIQPRGIERNERRAAYGR